MSPSDAFSWTPDELEALRLAVGAERVLVTSGLYVTLRVRGEWDSVSTEAAHQFLSVASQPRAALWLT